MSTIPSRLPVRQGAKLFVRSTNAQTRVNARFGRVGDQLRFMSSSTATQGSVSSFGSKKFAYGLLASVAFFSSVLGYSVGEWRRESGNVKKRVASTWQDVTYGTRADVESAIKDLREALPRNGAVETSPSVLQTYGFSENSYHPSMPHAVVVRPQTTEEVSAIVKIANKYRIPVTPYGGGTSLEGHFSGNSAGSICIDLDGMNKIIRIDEQDADLICQAGARWEDINSTLTDKGIPLFFPLDPGPGATIGGMIGTGCSGTNAVRYGTAKGEWFLNVTVVLPNGEIIKTRRRARKSSAGFDSTKLFIGAEGTLGIVTEATLRLAPLLPTKVALAQFPNVQHAVDAVQEILRSPYGNNIQCVELVDDYTIASINQAGTVDRTYPVKDSLFFKIQGSDDSIKATSKLVQAIVKRHNGSNFQFAATDSEAAALWEARKYALMSVLASDEGSRAWTTDVCVPVSKLPQLVQESKKDLTDSGLKAGIVGHVGDGNFHALVLFHDDAELPKVGEYVHRLVHRALALDGTCTGEHGVGVGKKEYLNDELGPGTVELMRRVKDAIDPNHIMNPGKLYPERQENRKSQ
ncbi:D-lactate dehydrogenase cytochrome oxidoreductase [Fomitiporia mediterranea MF3/22]|uniref:D-lactate dehydrogenase cytochrome oxidoreductase n=1 Tax=Fomitiporia mediterranea (strain MF3/22) TaxID=694068 RepID=UPI000440762A|nr:D-lactate dehydrogenase cytochrome oxidoreductase [Fomitiporia mediterranea MF3/22]EJD02134.1 D-lactate dehydrogenase cytochrome oxidoreductase [Fomitiporia mediterranea MF3/22]